jgi:glycosyltransferase involved in cell wall biosynthesis
MEKLNQKRKTIWIITEYYYPNENTTSYLLGLIAEGIAEYHNVNIITSTPGNKKETKNSVNIFRARDSSLDKNNLNSRIIKHTISGIYLFLKASKLVKRGDEVFVVTDPATSVFFIRFLKIFIPFKLTFMVHDLFPENLLIINAIKKGNLIYKFILSLYNWAFKGADRLIVIGRDMEILIKKKLKNQCPPIFIIPNFADVEEIVPMPKKDNLIIKSNKLENKFILLFTGTIGRLQGIQNLIDSMLLLKDNTEIHLLMIGDGAYKKSVEYFIKEHKLTNITLLHTMERKFSNDFLNAGDIGIVSLIRNCSGTAVPSKTYTYMAAGKPIFASMDINAEISILINESNIGWRVDPDNPEIFANKLKEISKLKEDLKLKGENSRKICYDQYSVKKAISNFLLVLN